MFSIRPRNRKVISYAEVTIFGNCCWKIFNVDGDVELFSPNEINTPLIMRSDGNGTQCTIKRIEAYNCNYQL